MSTAQQEFDKKYISSREIVRRLGITRPTVSQARKRGFLPEPVVVSDTMIFLWDRATVEPLLDAWAMVLNTKRAAHQQ